MSESASLLGFIAAALVLLLTPGPAVLYVVARSVSQGRRAGLVSVLGLSTGALVHVLAATVGLTAILVASAAAFSIVKLLGAGYLIYLGVRTLLSRSAGSNNVAPATRSMTRLFADGVVVNVLNPKIAVFFLAFLPQFADPARGGVPQQILFLGILYVVLALITDGAYALLAGRFGRSLGRSVAAGRLMRYSSGLVYIGLGIGTAFAERK